MSLHTELPIYKKGVELVSLAFAVQEQMPRASKRHLGEKITGHCTEMVNLMALANATRGAERAQHIRTLLATVHSTQVLLRVCYELRPPRISKSLWASSMVLLDGIGKQGGGWLKSAKAPAA